MDWRVIMARTRKTTFGTGRIDEQLLLYRDTATAAMMPI